MLNWIVVLVLIVIVLTIKYRKKLNGRKGSNGYLFLKDLPVVFYDIWNKVENLAKIQKKFEEYGDNYVFAIFNHYNLNTRNPDNIQYALTTDFDHFPRLTDKARVSHLVKWTVRVFGDGIFLADGDLWKMQRNVASKLFRKWSLESMVPVFVEHGQKLISILESEMKGGSVDLQNYFNRYTMDTFGVIGFGVELNSLESENNYFLTAFDTTQEKMMLNGVMPQFWFFRDQEFDEYLNYMIDFIDSIIETRKQSDYQDKTDLISRFMSVEGEDKLSDKILRDIVMNFVIAGKDTTAQLLSWMCYNLALYPEIYEKLTQEIDDFDMDFTQANIKSLKYLDNFVHETLRLFPSVPIIRRRSNKDNVFPDGTPIFNEEQLEINVYSLHRHPKYWDNPHEFNPDRWSTSPIKHPYQYLPFHGGPMVCLGKHLALLEAKTMIILFVQKFKMTLAEPVSIAALILMKSRNGINVHLSPR